MAIASKWIQTDFDFGLPMVGFMFSARDFLMMSSEGNDAVSFALSALRTGNPDKIEHGFLQLIRQYRPEFADGQLFGINLVHDQWEFLYAHPALPRTVAGNRFPLVPLIRYTEGRQCLDHVYGTDGRCLGCESHQAVNPDSFCSTPEANIP